MISIVVPVYNEGPILDVLVFRCVRSADRIGEDWELLLVDDGSTDETTEFVAVDPRVRVLHLPENRGQFGATRAGLAEARGDRVAVLDGDLQDPPEALPQLVAAHDNVDVVFAVTQTRADGLAMRAGVAVYRRLQRLGRPMPRGAGSYCVMTRQLAQRVAALDLDDANLAPALVALGASWAAVPIPKEARYDGRSRVGWTGLIREGLGSLALTGALAPAGRTGGSLLIGAGLLLGPLGWPLIPTGIALGRQATQDQNAVVRAVNTAGKRRSA